MAISKVLIIATFLLAALVVQIVQAERPIPNDDAAISSPSPSPSGPIDCKAACSVRCSKTRRTNLCLRACGTCCKRCNCVPPGTYGNYDACLCYATLTTHGGRRKCP